MSQKAIDDQSTQLTSDSLSFNPSDFSNPKTPWLSGSRGVLLGMAVGILLTVGGMRFLSSSQKPNSTTAPLPVKTATAAQSVTVTQVGLSSVNRTLKATGTVSAYEMIPVSSQANGLQIQQVLVDEGDFVKAGQVLALLDDSILLAQKAQAEANVAQAVARLAELRAGNRVEEIARARETVQMTKSEVIQAQSDLELAQKRLKLNESLSSEGAIARDRLDEIINLERNKQANLHQSQARLREAQQKLKELEAGPRQEVIAQSVAQLAAAKAQLQVVNAQLKDTRVIAPVPGKVAERNARVGDTTSSSQKMFTIIENGRLELRLKVPDNQLSSIRIGQNIEITSDADANLRLTGKVREITPIVDEKSRQAIIKVDFSSGLSLKPGMFLRAEIITSIANSLVIPMAAVLPQPDGTVIAYILQQNNTVKAQPIKLGEILSGEKVEILEGLKTGDKIIVKGAAFLKDKDVVKFKDEYP